MTLVTCDDCKCNQLWENEPTKPFTIPVHRTSSPIPSRRVTRTPARTSDDDDLDNRGYDAFVRRLSLPQARTKVRGIKTGRRDLISGHLVTPPKATPPPPPADSKQHSASFQVLFRRINDITLKLSEMRLLVNAGVKTK